MARTKSARSKKIAASSVSTRARKLQPVDWPQLATLETSLKARKQTKTVQLCRKLLKAIARALGGIYYVAEAQGICRDQAWQAALALLELCYVLRGQGDEQCQQDFQTLLAILLAQCPDDEDPPG